MFVYAYFTIVAALASYGAYTAAADMQREAGASEGFVSALIEERAYRWRFFGRVCRALAIAFAIVWLVA